MKPWLCTSRVQFYIVFWLSMAAACDDNSEEKRIFFETDNETETENENDKMFSIQYPVALLTNMDLEYSPDCPSAFVREIEFAKDESSKGTDFKSISVQFVKSEGHLCFYEGILNGDGLNTLKSLAEPNNRAYWDHMYLSNKLHPETNSELNQKLNAEEKRIQELKIVHMDIRVAYVAGHNAQRGSNNLAYMLISGLFIPNTLQATDHQIELSNWEIRACSACRYLHSQGILPHTCRTWGEKSINQCISDLEDAFPPFVREFIYDYGKSGSETAPAAGFHLPKYGSRSALCTETVTWYLATYSEDEDDIGFFSDDYNRECWNHLSRAFALHHREYCYQPGETDEDGSWRRCLKLPDENELEIPQAECLEWGNRTDTILPQPGDILIRMQNKGDEEEGLTGHTMMVLSWKGKAEEANKKRMHVIEGPSPIKFREPFDVDSSSKLYCIGRMNRPIEPVNQEGTVSTDNPHLPVI